MVNATSNLKIVVFAYIWVLLLKNSCNARRLGNLPKFPAIFVFGDSTVDTGNNNYVPTLFRANFHPYGHDYPNHVPTGRFSNGKLLPDLLASTLKIKEAIPPFLNPGLSNDELVTGVCFASAGAGYDNITNNASNVIPISKQIDHFRTYTTKLKGIAGDEKAKQIISGALVIMSAGTNDISTGRIDLNDTIYQGVMQKWTQDFVKELYDLGCRFMAIAGLPPLGCLPSHMTDKLQGPFNRQCLNDANLYAQFYNKQLVKLLPQMQSNLPGTKIHYIDIYQPLMDMINNPVKYGFTETKRGCCGTGFFEMGPLCNPMTPLCLNPSSFIFWDAVHPSEATYRYLNQHFVNNVLPKFL